MAEEEVAAAQAALDQAKAAVAELQPAYDSAQLKSAEIQEARVAAMADFKRQLNEAGEELQPLSVEMEKREGAVREAEAALAAAESGDTYEKPPTQGVGE